jgi:hypothetical protein
MSAEDSQGLTALMIFGNHVRKASAAAPLLVPDQLMNTSISDKRLRDFQRSVKVIRRGSGGPGFGVELNFRVPHSSRSLGGWPGL